MSQPEKFDDSLAELWKTQEVGPLDITLDAVKAKASKLEKTVRWRNMREWAGCAVVVPLCGWMALGAPNLLVQIGALEVILRSVACGAPNSADTAKMKWVIPASRYC